MTTESIRPITDQASKLTDQGSKLADQTNKLADQVADKAGQALRSTQALAHDAMNTLSDRVDEARDGAVPMLNKLSSQAQTAARRGADAVRETSAQLRQRAQQATDTTVGYIKDEPVKSMLIAAATGAALMALVSLVSRSRYRD